MGQKRKATSFTRRAKRYRRATTYRRRARPLLRRRTYRYRRPARLTRQNPRQVRFNRAVSRALNSYAETKYIALEPRIDNVPQPQAPDAAGNTTTGIWATFHTIGRTPPAPWAGCVALGGMQLQQGIADTQRIGSRVFLKHTMVKYEIKMLNPINPQGAPSTTGPVEFRHLLLKRRINNSKPAYAASEITYTDNLFLDEEGAEIGLTNGFLTQDRLYNLMVNKTDWIVVRDKRFTLQACPDGNNYASSRGFRHRKELWFKAPWSKRVNFPNDNSEPDDLDYHYLFITLARPLGALDPIPAAGVPNGYVNAGNWVCNIRGTTSFTDL